MFTTFQSRGGWSCVIKRHYVSDVPYVLIAQLNMAYRDMNTYNCGGLLCKSCDHDEELHELVTLYKLGGKLEYTVPSFPVFTAELRVAVFQFNSSKDSRIYNGFIRDCPQLERPFPCILRFCPGRSNSFFTDKEGFGVRKESDLYSGKVCSRYLVTVTCTYYELLTSYTTY